MSSFHPVDTDLGHDNAQSTSSSFSTDDGLTLSSLVSVKIQRPFVQASLKQSWIIIDQVKTQYYHNRHEIINQCRNNNYKDKTLMTGLSLSGNPYTRQDSLFWNNAQSQGLNGTPPDSKVHGANMGPTWVLSSPGGPHVGPMNLAFWAGHDARGGNEFNQMPNVFPCVSKLQI